MRRALVLSAILCLSAAPSAAQTAAPPDSGVTAADLVAKCARAMGGREKIDAVKTIRVQAVYPDHGERPLAFEIKRPDMSYTPQAQIAFDGKRGCWLKGQDQKSKPEMVDPGDLVDFDVEIGYFFPAIFDYPSEYAGVQTVDGRTAHALRVKLPHGAVMTYFLDAESGLPLKVNTRFTIRGMAIDNDRAYSDYRKVSGILYPHGFTYRGRNNDVQKARVTSVEFNIALDDAHFTVPDEIKK